MVIADKIADSTRSRAGGSGFGIRTLTVTDQRWIAVVHIRSSVTVILSLCEVSPLVVILRCLDWRLFQSYSSHIVCVCRKFQYLSLSCANK